MKVVEQQRNPMKSYQTAAMIVTLDYLVIS